MTTETVSAAADSAPITGPEPTCQADVQPGVTCKIFGRPPVDFIDQLARLVGSHDNIKIEWPGQHDACLPATIKPESRVAISGEPPDGFTTNVASLAVGQGVSVELVEKKK